MGVYLYNPNGGKEFFKDSAKSNEMVAAGYTFEPKEEDEDKPLTKPQIIVILNELGVEFDKTAKVADLRDILADIESDTDPEEE